MKVREANVSHADKRSAEVFFDAVLGFWDLSKADVLDAFARNGQLTVSTYHDRVGSVECWELGPEHKEALKQLTLNVKIGCSYGLAKIVNKDYDLIVVDTPQGLHADQDGDVKCEHFDFLPIAIQKTRPGGIVVLYVNTDPYNKDEVGSQGYDEYAEYSYDGWMYRRQQYYDIRPGQVLTYDAAILKYRDVIRRMGRQLGRLIVVPCFSDVPGKAPYAFRIALEVL